MIEFFGLGILTEFLREPLRVCGEAVLGHPIGELSAHCLRHLVGNLKEQIDDGKLPPNHDLRKAVEESLYEAARAFALGVVAYPNPPKALVEAIRQHFRDGTLVEALMSQLLQEFDRVWVKALIVESRRAHYSENGIASEFILKQGLIINLLVEQAPNEFQNRVHDAFADWLGRHVPNNGRPGFVDDLLAKGWAVDDGNSRLVSFYEAFCLFFRERIKKYPKAFNIFIAQTVSETAHNQKKLMGLPDDVARILSKLEQQKPSEHDFGIWFDSKFKQLEGRLTTQFEVVQSDLGELKAGQSEGIQLLNHVNDSIQSLRASLMEKPVKTGTVEIIVNNFDIANFDSVKRQKFISALTLMLSVDESCVIIKEVNN